jgi:hypothetical protein
VCVCKPALHLWKPIFAVKKLPVLQGGVRILLEIVRTFALITLSPPYYTTTNLKYHHQLLCFALPRRGKAKFFRPYKRLLVSGYCASPFQKGIKIYK